MSSERAEEIWFEDFERKNPELIEHLKCHFREKFESKDEEE